MARAECREIGFSRLRLWLNYLGANDE